MLKLRDGRATVNSMEPDAVRQQVERICSSDGFVNADRMCRFLRFTVETTLHGDRENIKEYLIGREVFDRDEQYDTRLDPIVRVEARRLRSRLEEYYARLGAGDPIRITFPKGSYAPVFEPAPPPQPSAGPLPPAAIPRRRWLVAGGGGALAVALYLVLWASASKPELVAVVPSAWFARAPLPLDAFEEGLVEAVTAELARRRVPVVAWPAMLRFRNGPAAMDEISRQMNATRILMLSARGEGNQASVAGHLFQPGSNRKLRVGEYRRDISQAIEVQRELARVIADEFETAMRGSSP